MTSSRMSACVVWVPISPLLCITGAACSRWLAYLLLCASAAAVAAATGCCCCLLACCKALHVLLHDVRQVWSSRHTAGYTAGGRSGVLQLRHEHCIMSARHARLRRCSPAADSPSPPTGPSSVADICTAMRCRGLQLVFLQNRTWCVCDTAPHMLTFAAAARA